MGTVALDGTKIHANASWHGALSYEHVAAADRKDFEPQHWPGHSFDGSVILFDDVIQTFVLTDFDVRLISAL